MAARTITSITASSRIDGVVPGIRAHRAFPTPELGILDPFVMLDHVGPQRLSADYHVNGHPRPHRGFETITMMLEGNLYHVDSMGNSETLSTGSTQIMVAGAGILHGGDMTVDADTKVFHEVQLWVNMPAAEKMVTPRIQSAHAQDKPVVDRGHYSVEVMAGRLAQAESPLRTTQPVAVGRIRTLAPGPIVLDVGDPSWNVLVYLLRGRMEASGHAVEATQTIRFGNDGSTLELTSTGEGVEALVLAGEPIDEPVVLGGPFVMNTPKEIEQAQADYAVGRFGRLPDGE